MNKIQINTVMSNIINISIPTKDTITQMIIFGHTRTYNELDCCI